MEPEETPTRLRNKPSWLISKAARRSQRLIGEAMAALDGRAYHFAILAALDEFGPDSQVRIGRRCGIDQSDMHAMLRELTEQGHVSRTADPQDRRRNLITVTRSGRRRLKELDSALSAVQDDLLKPLSATERDSLAVLLTRVLEHADPAS
ncbi:MarR family transcriptional regulator [Nocardia sp. CA2R105]|uniref:MarR family winged helix-turn-helix transcriptional regulator n=1 Tax=Nocardia coffeae TaxID=2873381 RepID=UPI001CA75F2D|nr:MarR family transcriptional regulator [Nocardia coffeae]MBY8856571.1 MarR family transcriptional regulator [Nocardia coffeae]